MAPAVGFLGGGMMASSLIGGFLKAGTVEKASMAVAEPFAPLRDKHTASGIFASADNSEVVARSDIIWLAVKPDVLPLVLKEVAALVGTTKLVVSIAAGVSLSTMEACLPLGARVIRVMPNLPCLVGECAAGFCRGTNATDADAAAVRTLLSSVGTAEEVPAKLMDAVTGLSGSGPAYGFLLVEALADGGVRAGLPRPVAQALAAQTIKGAAAMVLATGKHPGDLKDQVCSPGGTTIAGVEALEVNGFRAAAMSAVAAATSWSIELRLEAEKSTPKSKL
ncbi:hypothetical protein AB1Y20_007956 [Prymnesium parvum]